MVFLGVVAVGLLIGWALRSPTSEVVALGSPAPEFTVELLDGGEFSLSTHLESANGPLLINLWAEWCEPCRTEMPEFDSFALNNPEVTVLGVAVQDPREKSIQFAEEVNVSYPLAFGNRQFETAFPVFGLPATFLVDSSGVVTAIHRGILDEAGLEELVRR